MEAKFYQICIYVRIYINIFKGIFAFKPDRVNMYIRMHLHIYIFSHILEEINFIKIVEQFCKYRIKHDYEKKIFLYLFVDFRKEKIGIYIFVFF